MIFFNNLYKSFSLTLFMLKYNIPYIYGVELFHIPKSELHKLYGIYEYYPFVSKLKWVYVDYFDAYALFWSNSSHMPFHDWLVDIVAHHLKYDCITSFPWYQQTTKLPDIVYKNRFIEIETGLKHNTDDLRKRLYRSHNFTYVVVPNITVKRRYKLKLPAVFFGRLLTLKEFFNYPEL